MKIKEVIWNKDSQELRVELDNGDKFGFHCKEGAELEKDKNNVPYFKKKIKELLDKREKEREEKKKEKEKGGDKVKKNQKKYKDKNREIFSEYEGEEL